MYHGFRLITHFVCHQGAPVVAMEADVVKIHGSVRGLTAIRFAIPVHKGRREARDRHIRRTFEVVVHLPNLQTLELNGLIIVGQAAEILCFQLRGFKKMKTRKRRNTKQIQPSRQLDPTTERMDAYSRTGREPIVADIGECESYAEQRTKHHNIQAHHCLRLADGPDSHCVGIADRRHYEGGQQC
jgi:hypothetical protein